MNRPSGGPRRHSATSLHIAQRFVSNVHPFHIILTYQWRPVSIITILSCKNNIQIIANFNIRQRDSKLNAVCETLRCYYLNTIAISPNPFFLPNNSVFLVPLWSERDFIFFIINLNRGRTFDDLSFNIAYRHYLKRIKIAVVENLSASKLVVFQSECIIYRFYHIRWENCNISN